MEARRFHIAEFNISRLKAPLDSPIMKEFVDFLEPVNRFAEQSTGYVWPRRMDRPPPTCRPLMKMR